MSEHFLFTHEVPIHGEKGRVYLPAAWLVLGHRHYTHVSDTSLMDTGCDIKTQANATDKCNMYLIF
jgi:hypothetical protein